MSRTATLPKPVEAPQTADEAKSDDADLVNARADQEPKDADQEPKAPAVVSPAPIGLMITEDVPVIFTRSSTPKDRVPTQFDGAVGRLAITENAPGFTFTLPRDPSAVVIDNSKSSVEADQKILRDIRKELDSAGELHKKTVRWQVVAVDEVPPNSNDGVPLPLYRVNVRASKKITRPNRKKTTSPAAVDNGAAK